MKRWTIALVLACGLGLSGQTCFASLQPPTSQTEAHSPIDTIRQNVPWGASQDQVEASFGEADIDQPGFFGYRVQYEGTPMVLGYHFDEENHLYGASLTYPKPHDPSDNTKNYMRLVSEYGQPTEVNQADQTPVWLLEDNLMMTLVDGEEVQSILIIQK